MASSLSKKDDVELNIESTGSVDNDDDLALAKLGKKPVLKVCTFALWKHITLRANMEFAAPLWIPSDTGLQLYSPNYMGRLSGV